MIMWKRGNYHEETVYDYHYADSGGFAARGM
jgi:hypothetical protein